MPEGRDDEHDALRARVDALEAELRAATAAKSRFLASVSHEIRTPLGALLGFADLLLDPNLAEADRLNYAHVIRRNGEHLLELIDDILDLSKLEAGKLSVERLETSLAAVLSDVASLMRVRAHEKGLAFEVALETELPSELRTDPTRLRQVLLNLVGNAIKFTARGSVRLAARRDGETISLEVSDTGIGMTEAQLAGLFRPFEQADPSMSRRFGGTGLGLAISKPLVEALGGAVSARSEPGRGSTFRVILPADVPEGARSLRSLAEAPQELPESGTGRIPARLAGTVLLAEDGLDNQLLVSTILRRRGLQVVVVGDGAAAVEHALGAAAGGTPFDVVLMDMQLPALDGYAATAALRAQGYRGAVVALTAHALPGEREKCLAAGCDEYLSKPVQRGTLLEAVMRFLGPKGAPAAPLVSTFHADPELAGVVDRFVGGLPARVDELRAASADREALRALAHQLKGSAGGYGFAAISEAAARLEAALAAGAAAAELESLVDLCRRARARPS